MRRVMLIMGLLTLAAVWLSSLPQMAERAFWAHMTMHMGVVAAAAPLIALGIGGGRLDPVLRAPRLFSPVPASIIELVVVWAWHAPALHQAARQTLPGLVAEQGMFLTSGLLLWLSALGGGEGRVSGRGAAGIVGLLLTSMHMTLLGALLALTPRPLYHAAGHAHGQALDDQTSAGAMLAAIDDQHLGGAIMICFGGAAYLAGGLYLMAGLVRSATRAPEETV